MENKSFAQLLFYDGSGAPALAKKSVFVQPGKAFTVTDSTIKVYLAAGFPELTPQSEVPLSPTLQLNDDLASFSNDELQKIGRAELNRLNGILFRSYTQNPDYRVVVLASSPESLTRFMETYGGILEIEPLLVKGYDSDFQTVDDLHIASAPAGYALEYTVRTPIDKTLCSYCGQCGPVCPENCLDRDLFLDISKCSYCSECVKVCPANAIDLYRTEKHAVDIPAIVLLDGLSVEQPPENKSIYTPETLDLLFANLIPVQIEETVSLNHSLCQFSGNKETGCTICLAACKHKAIILNGGKLNVNYQDCTECGACMASCPTGALQYQRFNDKQFVDWFSSITVPPDSTIILGNEKHLHTLWWKKNLAGPENTLYVEYPNVQALNSMHLLFLVSIGAAHIILLDSTAELQNTPIGKQIQQTNSVLSAFFGGNERVTATSPETLRKISPVNQSLKLENNYNIFNYTNRREKLASVLHFLLKHETGLKEEAEHLTGPGFETFGSITCDSEKCTHCGACLNDCRIESLTSDENTLSLNHTGILCVQCGICVAVCPEDALTLNTGLTLKPDFFRHQELTRAEAMTCRECGKAFGTKKSFDHVMAKLKSHAVTSDATNFFEYCDTCRVVKLFESQQS